MVNQDKPMDSSKSMSNPNLALETIHLTCSRVNRSLDPFCVHISMVILSLNVVNPDVHPSSHGSDKGCNTIRHHQLIMPWSWRGIWMWSLSAALTASSELSIIALLPSTKSSAWKSPPRYRWINGTESQGDPEGCCVCSNSRQGGEKDKDLWLW